jgi:DNA-binding LacI/PurR family transcriptional regulator
VAKATVNSALEELEEEGVVRRRRGSGIFVSEQIGQKRVGLVFGENVFEVGRSPIYSLLLDRSRDRAASHGEIFSFYFDVPPTGADRSVPVHQDLVDALAKKRLHGLLLVSRHSIEQEAWLRAQGVPLVSLAMGASESYCCAVPDYAEIVRMGVRSLAEQGCRRIGLISALGMCSQGRTQAAVHRATLAQLGLPHRPEWVWERPGAELSDPEHGTRGEQGYQALLTLLEPDRHALDGVVINDDMMTLGVLAAAKKSGLAVGSDLKIATHANKGSLALIEHERVLTLLEFDLNEFVEAMFGMLESLMAGGGATHEPRLIRPVLRLAGQSSISR